MQKTSNATTNKISIKINLCHLNNIVKIRKKWTKNTKNSKTGGETNRINSQGFQTEVGNGFNKTKVGIWFYFHFRDLMMVKLFKPSGQ